MDRRRWWLLAGAVPVALGCGLAAVVPALRTVGELVVITAGLLAGVALWFFAARSTRPRAWRLFAFAPLFPAIGALMALLAGPLDPAQLAVVRWVPTVPGYLVAIGGILSLVDRGRLRAGLRVAVEVGLFYGACMVVVSLLVVGPAGRWSALALDEKVVLGAAVVASSATMAAALTVLGVIEAGRRSIAVVLLAGTVLLALGRGLGTSDILSGQPAPLDAARFFVSTGLVLLVLAVLVDRERPAACSDRSASRTIDVGQLLPHVALLVASVAVGSVALTGQRPSQGTIAGLVICVTLTAVHRGLTARDEQRMSARLRRSEAYFRSVVQSAGDATVTLDDDLRITWASPALQRALGPAAGELVGRRLLESVHPDDIAALAAALTAVRTPGSDPVPAPAVAGLLTVRLMDSEGEWRYLEAGISDLRADGDVGAVVLHCRDMTERYAREQALQSVAYTDPMTGLPNRAGVLRALQEAVDDEAQAGVTLLMIELDGLAAARENAGREVVSTVVAEVGRRLRATVRGEDVVARMGGGAFAVLAQGDDEDADRLAARCLAVVELPIATPAGIVDLTAGVGVVPLLPGLCVDDLLVRADLAVRAAHEAGLGRARRYDVPLGEAAARRELLRTQLQGAVARGELFLVFHPIVSLADQRIAGVEAQLGWRHATLGEVPVAEFLPVAERAGLLGELVRWKLEEATRVATGLPASAASLRIALKIPLALLTTGTVVGDVERALRQSGLSPERLVLQISAPAVISGDERLGLDISSLRLMGVHVALDGFGSGSSALAHLTRLPIDMVKLDRSLISRIDRDPQSRALCESIVGIGRALGLGVVAEGVETPAQLAALNIFGCGFAQGFAIARPMPLPRLAAMLAEGPDVPLPGLVGSR